MSEPQALPSLDDIDVDNRRVFCRVDFNVPLDGGQVADDTRIRAALPTLRELISRGARVVCASHLGRPKGKVVPELSMEPVAARLAELLEVEVRLPDEVVGDGVTKVVNDLPAGGVVLLENLRFEAGETKNDPDFAAALGALGDAYVNDAFGACHRAHASVVGITEHIRDRAQGRLVEAETRALGRLLHGPDRPFVALVGGAKVSDKLGVLLALIDSLQAGDAVVVGGAMANSFLAARGHSLGKSLVERERFADCRRLEKSARARDVSLLLPSDLRAGESLDASEATVVPVETEGTPFPADAMALDIGPQSTRRFAAAINRAGTVFWNGPMGVFENPAFAEGTLGIAKAMAEAKGFRVVGGGDSVAAVNQAGVAEAIDHVSTGGGASLTYVEAGGRLPGLDALLDPA